MPKNECFACGKDNPEGMHLEFVFDEANRQAICHLKLPKRFQGPPGHAHGGIIATILDEAMGKVNKLRHVVAVTKTMNVEYIKLVPLGAPLTVIGMERRVSGREHHNAAEIRNEKGEVLSRSEGLFIAIDPEQMMAKMKAQLDQWSVQMAAWETSARGTRSEAKKQFGILRSRLDDAFFKLELLQGASVEAWQDIRVGADKARSDMHDAIEKARAHFKEI